MKKRSDHEYREALIDMMTREDTDGIQALDKEIDEIEKTGELPFDFCIDLSGLRLEGKNLSVESFKWALFGATEFLDCDLSGWLFVLFRSGEKSLRSSKSKFVSCILNSLYHQEESLRGIHLENCDIGAPRSMMKMDLFGATLIGLDFQVGDFTETDLRQTRIHGCDFSGAHFYEVRFHGSEFPVTMDSTRLDAGDNLVDKKTSFRFITGLPAKTREFLIQLGKLPQPFGRISRPKFE